MNWEKARRVPRRLRAARLRKEDRHRLLLIRISNAKPLNGFRVELTLTTGEVLQREEHFRQLRAHDVTIVWPNGADLCLMF